MPGLLITARPYSACFMSASLGEYHYARQHPHLWKVPYVRFHAPFVRDKPLYYRKTGKNRKSETVQFIQVMIRE